MLEADCPCCETTYFYGSDELAEPMTCDECGCIYALEAPDGDEGDEGEVIYERI
jgi:hypothetical protein